MKSKFSRLPCDMDWASFYRAGDSWLESLQLLLDNKNDPNLSWSIFYVIPYIIALCIELYAKALVLHDDKNINLKGKYSHSTSKLVSDNAKKYPIFKKITNDSELLTLIKEYEKAKDIKYGVMAMNLDGEEESRLVNLIYEIRQKVSEATG